MPQKSMAFPRGPKSSSQEPCLAAQNHLEAQLQEWSDALFRPPWAYPYMWYLCPQVHITCINKNKNKYIILSFNTFTLTERPFLKEKRRGRLFYYSSSEEEIVTTPCPGHGQYENAHYLTWFFWNEHINRINYLYLIKEGSFYIIIYMVKQATKPKE